MNIKTLNNNAKTIMDCKIQDSTGLNDFQKLPNKHGTAIPKVGIERFRLPLTFIHEDGEKMTHDGEASMSCSLAGNKTGVNMSRFVGILQEENNVNSIDGNFFKKILNRYRMELRDYDHEDPISQTSIQLSFSYPLKKKSLKSKNWGWQYYKTKLKGTCNQFGHMTMSLTVEFEYSSTCPCSLSMAKQYEQDFAKGKTTEGNGVAAAHGQRSLCICQITYGLDSEVKIEELIELLRKALPTETQPLVKRLDEQAFAILNGDNPMFVEHASRRLSHVLNQEPRILDWETSVEHFESLHSHNAVAYIRKEHPANN